MAKENGALPGLLPVVLGFLEIDNGHCCGKTDIRACSGVGAQVDQREGHEMSATQILQIAEWTIADRGKEYDSTKGERSGARVAAAFSAITGKRITAAEVYLLLQLVKDARQWSRHRYHEDCREVLPLLPKHDLVLTDPPYGIGYAANPIVGKGKKASNHAGKTWDEETPPPWLFGLMQEKGKHMIVWGGNYYPLPTSRGWLSWFKPDSPPSMGHFELAWTSMDMLCRQFERSIGATNYERVGHPTQKPIMLMGWCIDMTPDNATVLDPFMGSGTTGVACAQLGKSFTGIERERKYFDIACERIENAYRQEQMFPVDIEPARAQDALL